MGILALHSKKVRKDLVGIAYYGMYALQHRGQEAAGIAVLNEKNIRIFIAKCR